MTFDSLIAAVPFLAYVAALVLTWKYSRLTQHRDLRARLKGIEADVATVNDKLLQHLRRDAAAASVEAREAKRAGEGGGNGGFNVNADPSVQRAQLQQHFAMKDRQ